MADRIAPTTRSNKLLGLLADALDGAYGYTQRPDPTMPMGKANPVLGLLADALPLRAGANVLDDLSYGQAPIRGTGMTTRLTPDATELAMAAAPFPKTSSKAALAALGAVDTGVGKAMFIGPTAKTWDRAAAATAQKLEKAGADPRAIWSETGTFKGPDGKWRQEIDDSGAAFHSYFKQPTSDQFQETVKLRAQIAAHDAEMAAARKDPGFSIEGFYSSRPGAYDNYWAAKKKVAAYDKMIDPGPKKGPLGQFVEHDKLSAAYPFIDEIPTTHNLSHSGGSYTPGLNSLLVGGGNEKSIALHEIQHAIQKREGFARGGSPADFSGPKTEEALKELIAQQTQGLEPFSAEAQAIRDRLFDSLKSDDAIGYAQKLYRRLAGEAEARATQARMKMTPDERRATFPYDSYDVPVNQLIVRGLLD